MTAEPQPLKVSWLNISVNVVMDDAGLQTARIQIDYVPVARPPDAPGVETELEDYRDRLELPLVNVPAHLVKRIGRVTDFVRGVGLALPTIEIDGASVRANSPQLIYYSLDRGRPLLPRPRRWTYDPARVPPVARVGCVKKPRS